MQLQISSLASGILGIVATAFVIAKLSMRKELDAIPTVGSSTWLGSWWAGLKFLINGTDIVQEGYDKHKAAAFKVANKYSWLVIVSGRQYLEEIRRSSEDHLSFMAATNDALKLEYTMGHDIHYKPYHIQIIRSQLTRSLGVLYPDIRDEVVTAFEEILDLEGNGDQEFISAEWKSVVALGTIEKVVCRTSNRTFVGLPLCRNPDWIDLNVRFTVDAVKEGIIMGLFPTFMVPFVAPLISSLARSTRRGVKLLRPTVEERQKHLERHGSAWADKPNDVLSWLMDEAEGSERSITSLTQRVLAVNFVAIHSFTQALYNLAANPQYMQPLREEVESIIATEGCFLKESQRMEGLPPVLTMARQAMKDFSFSDGTVIPKGTIVAVASRATHFDNDNYEHADMFDPFRFANVRSEDGEGVKHQFSSTNPEYLPFGHGQHACPGRFFAAIELKTMLAHIDGATRPQSLRIGTANAANSTAKVMFRKRAQSIFLVSGVYMYASSIL
ncbi:cytochrome P450 [Melanogaster broomeanus]|nr:cytochrome P450 [Melanogaster broomeanus]